MGHSSHSKISLTAPPKALILFSRQLDNGEPYSHVKYVKSALFEGIIIVAAAFFTIQCQGVSNEKRSLSL